MLLFSGHAYTSLREELSNGIGSDLAVHCSHLAANEHLGLYIWGLQKSPICALNCALGKSHHRIKK